MLNQTTTSRRRSILCHELLDKPEKKKLNDGLGAQYIYNNVPHAMPPRNRPHCGYCFKEFFKAKDVQLHIGNSPICRAARNRERSRREPRSRLEPTPQENAGNADNDMGDVAQYQEEANYIPSDRWEEASLNEGNADELPNRRTTVEEVEDEEAPGRYGRDYDPDEVAHRLGEGQTAFERLREEQIAAGLGSKPWAPFEDEEEWDLAQFLMTEVSQTAADKFLKLPIVSGTHRK
jgi:hypothetical protein